MGQAYYHSLLRVFIVMLKSSVLMPSRSANAALHLKSKSLHHSKTSNLSFPISERRLPSMWSRSNSSSSKVARILLTNQSKAIDWSLVILVIIFSNCAVIVFGLLVLVKLLNRPPSERPMKKSGRASDKLLLILIFTPFLRQCLIISNGSDWLLPCH